MSSHASSRAITILLGVCMLASSTSGQIYNLREMNTEQIRSLDLNRTVVIIPGGILEQHGPYLPSFTDGYISEYLSHEIAKRIVARPGWSVLIFPTIPLGAGGANQMGFKHVFPGTYHVHFSSLRSTVMDIGAELGEAGFRWIFVVSEHGAMAHKRALDQASDFFNDTYRGTMVHLTRIVPPKPRTVDLGLNDEERAENGLDMHGAMGETSRMLFVRADLVRPGYATSKPHTGHTWEELIQVGQAGDWPGYFGSPRLATATRGAKLMEADVEDLSELTLSILDGLDHRQLARTLTNAANNPGRVRYSQESDRHDATIEAKKRNWLQSRHLD